MATRAFVVSAEVRPEPGCELYGSAAGAFVYAFALASSPKQAEKMVSAALAEDRYRLVRIEFVENASGLDWDSTEAAREAEEAIRSLSSTEPVVYAPFYTYRLSALD